MTNPFGVKYYTEDDLKDAGFKRLGKNVRISSANNIVGLENIEIGDNVRIDSYCTIIAATGWLKIGSYVHIGGTCTLGAGAGIEMEDFCGLSHGVRIFSKSDDFSGKHMTNPMVPSQYTGVKGGPVIMKRHAVVGASTVILPDVTIGEGVAIGALSLVMKSLTPWTIYLGAPVKAVKARSKDLLELERSFLASRENA